jgi:hypothetical protein
MKSSGELGVRSEGVKRIFNILGDEKKEGTAAHHGNRKGMRGRKLLIFADTSWPKDFESLHSIVSWSFRSGFLAADTRESGPCE